MEKHWLTICVYVTKLASGQSVRCKPSLWAGGFLLCIWRNHFLVLFEVNQSILDILITPDYSVLKNYFNLITLGDVTLDTTLLSFSVVAVVNCTTLVS